MKPFSIKIDKRLIHFQISVKPLNATMDNKEKKIDHKTDKLKQKTERLARLIARLIAILSESLASLAGWPDNVTNCVTNGVAACLFCGVAEG